MKNKIVVLYGKSASGKDTILQELLTKWFQPIISHTTRPMREGEVDGKDYHFISTKEFLKELGKDNFIETRSYDTLLNGVSETWHYGVHTDSIKESDKDYITILDMQGLKEFIEYFGKDKVVPIGILASDETRKYRASRRGSFCETEWNRRLKADDKDFANFFDYKVFLNEDKELDEIVEEIYEYIMKEKEK